MDGNGRFNEMKLSNINRPSHENTDRKMRERKKRRSKKFSAQALNILNIHDTKVFSNEL